jgi:hypothetical protein
MGLAANAARETDDTIAYIIPRAGPLDWSRSTGWRGRLPHAMFAAAGGLDGNGRGCCLGCSSERRVNSPLACGRSGDYLFYLYDRLGQRMGDGIRGWGRAPRIENDRRWRRLCTRPLTRVIPGPRQPTQEASFFSSMRRSAGSSEGTSTRPWMAARPGRMQERELGWPIQLRR